MQDQGNDQKNFIVAMVLSGIVLIGYWFFFGKPLAEKARADALKENARIEEVAANPPEPIQAREVLITEGTRINIDTPSLKGSFLTTGSRFDDIELKNYDKTLDSEDGPVELLTPEGADHAAYLTDNWVGVNGGLGFDTPWSVVSGTTLTETSPVILQTEVNDIVIERTITVDDRYLITLNDKLTNTSSGERSLIRRGVSRQHQLPRDVTNFFIIQEGPISVVDNKYHEWKYKKLAKKESWSETGSGGWVGLTDKYWLSAAIAPQGQNITASYDYRAVNTKDVYETSYALSPLTLTPGVTVESVGHLYAGAKDWGVLTSYEENLGITQMTNAIGWGKMKVLVKPINWSLSKLGDILGNYGLGILALTFLIKVLMFPLFNKQYESQAKMKKVQPKVKKLQALYKDDRMKMQQEMMGLYKKEGVNPAAGCLPIIPTIFVFFSLYKAVFINIDLRHEPFFGWIRDLSAKDPLSILNGFGLFPWDAVPIPILGFLAIGPLAIMYGISMSLMYTLTPPAGDPMQAKIFKFMPWVFMFILAPFATGLLLYWVWNNILSFGQQYYITRKFKVDTPVDAFWRKITGKEEPAKD
ncbi:membrane protein insertase YidC [Hellea sp.]|nr:membrane protein insertase YidC [Hellea sp.]